MKAIALLLCASGLLMTGLAITPPSSEMVGVVTLGPTLPPIPTPRVRVSNDREDSVDVWYLVEGSTEPRRLGAVAGGATQTFQVPQGVGIIRLILDPDWSGEPLVTSDIQVAMEADIGVEVAAPIERSRVKVGAMRVVRERPQ